MKPTVQLTRWTSRGRLINKSSHHTDMYIVESGDGTFHTMISGHETMLANNPPDKTGIDRKRTKFITSEQYLLSVKMLLKSREMATQPKPTKNHRPLI